MARGAGLLLPLCGVVSILCLAACGSAAPGQSSGAQANHHPSSTTKAKSAAKSSGSASGATSSTHSAAASGGGKSAASSTTKAGASSSSATTTQTSANVQCVAGKAGTQELVDAAQEPAAGVATPNAACWGQIQPTALFQTVIGKAPAGASASFKVAWSGQDLYVLADVQHWPMYCATGAEWYNCDAVEIYVGPNDQAVQYGPEDRQLGVRAEGGLFETGTNGASVTNAKTSSVITQKKGYLAEMILPLSDIGVKAASGALVGFSIAADMPLQLNGNQGNSTVAQMMWAGNANNWQSAAHWGAVMLQ